MNSERVKWRQKVDKEERRGDSGCVEDWLMYEHNIVQNL